MVLPINIIFINYCEVWVGLWVGAVASEPGAQAEFHVGREMHSNHKKPLTKLIGRQDFRESCDRIPYLRGPHLYSSYFRRQCIRRQCIRSSHLRSSAIKAIPVGAL